MTDAHVHDASTVAGVGERLEERRDVRVFVNERGVNVPAGGTAADAVGVFDSTLADALIQGDVRLTDSRGLPLDAAARVHGGMIVRTIPIRR